MGWFLLLCYLPCHVTGLIKGVNMTLKTTVVGQIVSVIEDKACIQDESNSIHQVEKSQMGIFCRVPTLIFPGKGKTMLKT